MRGCVGGCMRGCTRGHRRECVGEGLGGWITLMLMPIEMISYIIRQQFKRSYPKRQFSLSTCLIINFFPRDG